MLGMTLPDGLTFLPAGFERLEVGAPIMFAGEATTLRKLFLARGIPADRPTAAGSDTAFIHNKSHDWVAPTIFIGAELLKTDPNLISACIDVIRERVTTLFGGLTGGKLIKASIILERSSKKSSTKISYEGDAAGLAELAKVLKALPDD